MNQQGLYNKFSVTRTDGRHAAGEKHAACEHFVLDVTHDKHALPALAAYAASCKDEFPLLASDLRAKLAATVSAANVFITVPDVKLPNGITVPSFSVGKYLSSKGMVDTPQVTADGAPWVRINYEEARAACVAASMTLITELQALAIAHDIANQDINWTGGKVGEGKIYQGLHKGTVGSPQPATFVSPNADERRWHQLSNGEQIFDFAGNAYTWVFDNVQGDECGLIAKAIAADSPSLTTAPYASMTKGMGWRPDGARDWSGHALVRGGCWHDGDSAGVFVLNLVWPDSRGGRVGFRCTK